VDPAETPLRILWGSPLPPIRSGVSDYAVELLPELADLARVRVLVPVGWRPPSGWPEGLETVPLDAPRHDGEIALLHLGNNPYHLPFIDRLRKEPSAVVVHDAVLHHLLVEETLARGHAEAYEHRLQEAYGSSIEPLVVARSEGMAGRLDPFVFPARRAVLEAATAVVVHSEWARRAVRADLPDTPVDVVPLTVADPGAVDRLEVRRRLGLDPDDVVVMHLGFLTPEKGLNDILAGVAGALAAGVAVRLVIVGEGVAERALRDAVAGTSIEDRVVASGWVEPELFPRIPGAADLGVVLRSPSAGETSAAVLRFLACGVPVAVSGVRQFLEWPEPAAPRVTPGPSSAAELARIVTTVRHPSWRDRERAARAVYERGHVPKQVASELVRVLAGRRDLVGSD
jgi:glycosyltransferase involved in cell wall biosynthesis